MDDTIREKIILEFIARAAVIRTTGSPQLYATDCGETVFRATPQVDPDDLPCCIIWPQAEDSENINGKCRHKMPIQVEGIMVFSPLNPSVTSEKILGDLFRCFLARTWERRRLVASPASPPTYDPPYAESIVYLGGGTDSYPEEGSKTVGAMAKFMVTYYTKIGDPYSQ